MRTLQLRIPPLLVVLLLGAAMALLARLLPAFAFALPAKVIAAAAVGAAGTTIATAGVISFRRARTTVNPLQPGAATQLVVSGLYRWSRNPMYLGMLFVLVGWALLLANAASLGCAFAFVPLMNRLQIEPEERILTTRFGAEFAAYKNAVRRWL
jgi:protein-S-isoprenylcysteine O-methyltransferase Ste14